MIDFYDIPPETGNDKTDKSSSNKNKNPDCMRCSFFRITWQPDMPYSCAKFGFKCRSLPCLEVLNSSGEPCRAVMPKA